MTDLGLLAWIREFAADSIGFDSKKLFEISCNPEKAGFSGSGFGILLAHRGYSGSGLSDARWRCVIMSNLASPKTGCTSAELKQAWLCSRFALFFESRTQSRTAEQAERRIKRSLNYAEAKPALAAEQQQYAPSFSLSAPCILLTLTHRLRFISKPYFDTPSFAVFRSDSLAILLWKTRSHPAKSPPDGLNK